MSDSPRRAFVSRRSDGEHLWSLGGHFTTKLSGEQSDGGFALVEAIAFRSTEPPLHIHTREDEAWYVLDGQMTLYVGDESFVVPSGTFAFAPRGQAHAFTVVKIKGDKVLLDGNHALAGKALRFAVTVMAVRAATEEEITHRHVHGEHGHHH